MMTLSLTHINNAIPRPRLPYDPLKDFAPLSQLATGGPMPIARASSPYSNVAEFVACAKTHPGITYGTLGQRLDRAPGRRRLRRGSAAGAVRSR